VHPQGQSRFRLVKRLGPSYVLPACPTRLTRCGSPFTPEFQLKLGQTCEDARHHAACGVRRVDAFPQGAQHDLTLSKLANRGHYLSGVAVQAVDADNDYHINFACVG
jgi:hypothetical protein